MSGHIITLLNTLLRALERNFWGFLFYMLKGAYEMDNTFYLHGHAFESSAQKVEEASNAFRERVADGMTFDEAMSLLYDDLGVNEINQSGSPYCTVKEAAELKGVCPATIRRWIKKGYLSATISAKKTGYRIRKADLNISWKERKQEEYRKQLATMTIVEIIELFEDFLDERGIKIDNPEKEESEDPSTIYGTDFGELFEGVKDILKEKEVTEGLLFRGSSFMEQFN